MQTSMYPVLSGKYLCQFYVFCIPFPKKLKEFDNKALSYISIWHCSILKRSAFSWILRYLVEKYWKNILGPDWRTIESTGDREAPCMQIIKSDENLVLKRKIVHQQSKRKKHKKVLQEEDIERLCRNIVLENIWAAGYNSKKKNRRKKLQWVEYFTYCFSFYFGPEFWEFHCLSTLCRFRCWPCYSPWLVWCGEERQRIEGRKDTYAW